MKTHYMTGWKQVQCIASVGGLLLTLILQAPGATLTPGESIVIEKTKGNFDFIRMDIPKHRLLLAHTGNKTLDVFDVETKKLLKSVPTGAAQDAAVDVKRGRYYASISSPPRMAIVDSEKLEMIGEVPLSADADLMTFNPANGLAYVCNDTAPELWVIDPDAKKIVATITFAGKGMEDLVFDPSGKKLFQVLKEGKGMFVMDSASNKIIESWTVAPATGLHGIALVPEADQLLAVGSNGKLILVNRSTGKILATADVASGVDEMAYDPELHLAYCASSQGKISVVRLNGEQLNLVETITTNKGQKSLVVDTKTHTVWTAYSKDNQSFVQPFTPEK